MSHCQISCELHDYIEIACLYGYQVRLELKDGQRIEGKALDIMTSAEKTEYLMVDNAQNQSVALNQLHKMQVLTPNAKFSEVVF